MVNLFLYVDSGFPGQLTVQVTYGVTEHNDLTVHMAARTTAPTLCNLVSHTYWNLAGMSLLTGLIAKWSNCAFLAHIYR